MAEPTNYTPDPMPDTFEGNVGGTTSFGTLSTVAEIDGSPSVSNVSTIRFSNGTVTDDGGGQVTVTTGGTDGTLYGAVDPEGVQSGSRGDTYVNTATNTFWIKTSGDATTTGWTNFI